MSEKRSPGGLVEASVLGAGSQRYGAIGGAQDTRDADNTYAAGDVIAYIASLGTAPPAGFETLSTPWKCLGWLDTSGGVFTLSHSTKDVGAAGSLSAIRTVVTGGTKTLQFTALEALNPYTRALYDDVPVSALAPAARSDVGGVLSGSNVVTDVSAVSTDVGSTVVGTGIPVGATIVSVTPGTSFVLSAVATATSATDALTVSANISRYVMPEVPGDNQYCVLLDTVDGNKAMRLFSPKGKVTARGNDQVQQADTENLQMTFTFYPTTITLPGQAPTRGELARYVQYNPGKVPASFSM